MSKKLSTTKKVKHNKKHVHMQDIPLRYFPKTKGNKSRAYKDELIRMIISLRKTNQNVQYNAQVSIFNIRSITQKSGFVPSPPEVFRAIEDFVYHYENYCYRAFSFREKYLHFINSVLPVGYPDNQRELIRHLTYNPIIKQAKLLSVVKRFDTNNAIQKVLEDRNSLTHRLYYGDTFDHFLRPKDATPLKSKKEAEQKKWFNNWKEEIEKRANMTNNFMRAISKMDHNTASKIMGYKDSMRRK
ncbi:MAG: Cthe_2314 family HEPN domain-containing protein [Candidatus Yanofskybacteria bacterium]|nr:Cthe_2314 family HEPN domain-containing protein [Candidatus Yanofskybacteria bacterium]